MEERRRVVSSERRKAVVRSRLPVAYRSPFTESRRQPLDRPAAAAGAAVEDAVVQAVLAPLPELDRFGREAVAAPVRRPRHRFRVPARDAGEAALEGAAAGEPRALVRRPRGELAAARASGEVLEIGRAHV